MTQELDFGHVAAPLQLLCISLTSSQRFRFDGVLT